MKRRRGMPAFRAGVIALVVTGVLAFVGFMKGVPGVVHHYTVRAVFASATNLLTGSSVHPGSPVRIAGVDVGQVTKVERGPGGTAVISMRIDDRGRPVHADATAKIRPRLFLEGNFFVDMTAGSPGAPVLPDGATIPLGQTAVPVQLDQVLDALDFDTRKSLKSVLHEYATALNDGGAEALAAGYRAWPGAFRYSALATQASLGQRPHDLGAFVAAAAKTSRAVAARDQDLADLVTSFDRSVTAFADRREELAGSLSGLRDLSRTAPSQLTAIDRATAPIERFSRAALPGLRTAPPVLRDTIPFLGELGRLVAPEALPALVADLGPTVKTLADAEPDLVSLFNLVAPVTSCVTTHALPVLKSKVDDGALSSGQMVWEEILHTASGLASATQNFDGTGYNTRFSFGSGEDLVTLKGAGPAGQNLFATGAIDGSRPPRPDKLSPFRPHEPCAAQPLPNLSAPAQAPVGQQRTAKLDQAAMVALGRLIGSGR